MTEEEKKVIEYFKKSFTSKTPPYWYDDTIENSEIKIKTLVNLIEKLQNENERQQDIIIEKDRQLYLTHKEIQSVREQAWEITDKSLKDILMLNTPKIIIESKEDIKGLLDNYIPKSKIKEKLNWYEDICERLSKSGIELDMYDRYQGAIELCKELLEED